MHAAFGPQKSVDEHWLSLVHMAPLSGAPASLIVQRPVVVLQTGSSLGQVADVVHWTQVPVDVLHTGVDPEQLALDRQATQSPDSGPLVEQRVERQSAVPSVAVQGPSPFA